MKGGFILNTLAKSALWILCLYVGYCLLLFLFQRQLMFPRGLIEPLTRSQGDRPGLETMWIDSRWGRTEAWFVAPAAQPSGRPSATVIFAHGNAELIDYWVQELSPLTRLGVGLLLVEYPGYGRSQGRPSQASITAIMVAAYDRLVARQQVDPDRIVLMGRSIGGGAVCQLASRRPAAALILLSTFTSARAFAPRYLAPGFLVKDPFDNQAVLQDFEGPVLLVHGRHDDIIPFYHGQRLQKAARNAQLIAYPCGHNDCPPRWDIFWQDIEGFLRRSGLLNEPPGRGPHSR